MEVTFQKPVVIPEKGCHSFTLLDVPVFEAPAVGSPPHIDFTRDCSGELLEFAAVFLAKAAGYFSKPLPAAAFLQRVKHVWRTDEFRADELRFDRPAHLRWIPAAVLFYKGSHYELEWHLVEIVEAPEQAPPSGLDAESLDGEGPAAPAAAVPAAEPPLEEVPSVPSAPPAPSAPSALPPPLSAAAKERFKQKVRKARLRAALAQMRAEKMAERYYLRYGNLDLESATGSGSDSDLSFEDGNN